jgi:acetylornithine deacetylase
VRLTAVDGFATSVAAFATDLPSLTNWGTPYLFGPGSVHVAHTDDEFVSVAELEQAVDAYVRLAMSAIARVG